jgi:hypothetical protein
MWPYRGTGWTLIPRGGNFPGSLTLADRWDFSGYAYVQTCVVLKILQMKVVRLEHLVKLKDLRIGELMRPGANGHQIPGAARPKSAKP